MIPGTYTAKSLKTFSESPRIGRARKEDTWQQTWKDFANGSVPGKEQMLAFNYGSQEEFEELLRYYRGEGGRNEIGYVD